MSETKLYTPPHVIRSLIALLVGSFLLRTAAGAMGENLQFYFSYINAAANMPDHALHAIAGAGNVSAITFGVSSLIINIFFIAEVIGAPLFGAWSDKYGRKLFIIFGPLFGAIAVQLTAMTTILWLLAVTRVLEGLSTASNAPASLGYIADATSHAPKLRARVVGFFELATIAGFGAGTFVGGQIFHAFGEAGVLFGIPMTSPAFAVNALIYLASLVILWFGMSEAREFHHAQSVGNGHGTWSHYWKLLKSPRIASFIPAWIAINAVLGVFINLTAQLLTDKLQFQDQLLMGRFNSIEASNLRGTYVVFFGVGILIWSLFSARLRKPTVMLIGIGGLFVTCLILYLINHQPSLDAPLVLPLAILLVVSIMVQSGFTPAAVIHLADITEEYTEDRGIIMGLYSVFLGVGQAIGVIGGPFADWRGWDGAIFWIFLCGVFAAAFLIPLYRSEARLAISKVAPTASNGLGK